MPGFFRARSRQEERIFLIRGPISSEQKLEGKSLVFIHTHTHTIKKKNGRRRTEVVLEFRSPVPSSASPCTLTFDLTLIQTDSSLPSLRLPRCPSASLSSRSYLPNSRLSIAEHITHYIVASRARES